MTAQTRLKKAYRIVTFLPVGESYISAPDMVAALNSAFPINYGNYTDVAWYGMGTEQFRPLQGSNPTHGQANELASIPSVRLEISLPHDDALASQIVDVIASMHPWEEPVVQVYEVLEMHSDKR